MRMRRALVGCVLVLGMLRAVPAAAARYDDEPPMKMTAGARAGRFMVGLIKLGIVVAVVGGIVRTVRKKAPTDAERAAFLQQQQYQQQPPSPGASSKCRGCGLVNMPGPTCRRCNAPL